MTKHKCNEAGQAPTSKNGPMIDYTAYVLLNRRAPCPRQRIIAGPFTPMCDVSPSFRLPFLLYTQKSCRLAASRRSYTQRELCALSSLKRTNRITQREEGPCALCKGVDTLSPFEDAGPPTRLDSPFDCVVSLTFTRPLFSSAFTKAAVVRRRLS